MLFISAAGYLVDALFIMALIVGGLVLIMAGFIWILDRIGDVCKMIMRIG